MRILTGDEVGEPKEGDLKIDAGGFKQWRDGHWMIPELIESRVAAIEAWLAGQGWERTAGAYQRRPSAPESAG